MALIKHNLKALIAQWEVDNSQKLRMKELSESAGVGFQTIDRYANGLSNRIDLKVCEALIDWFALHKIEITMNDLFLIEQQSVQEHEDKSGVIVSLASVFKCDYCNRLIRTDSLDWAPPPDAYNGEYFLADCYHCHRELELDVLDVRR